MNSTVLLRSVDIKIPGYRIIRPIGEGGMASVFLAVQESLDREVALKVMAPALAANAEFTDRFLKEGRITAKLSHPNLVTVFDIGSHGTVYYLAAEFIPGGTLRERIQAGLSIAETLDIACDVARGLDFAHNKGFVHRDVKPGNILFKADGTAVLADFGIAKAMDAGAAGATMAGASIGTPDYMSPEQARAEQVDGRSDIYALGAVLFEMLVGHPPYEASDPFTVALMHVTQPVPTLPDEHAWLQPLIDVMMAKLPSNRFENGEAFIQAVEKLLAASPQAASITQSRAARKRSQGTSRLAGSTQRTVGVKSSRPAWIWPAVGAAAALVIGVGLWLALRPAAEVDPLQTADPLNSTTTSSTSALPMTVTVTGQPDINVPTPVDDPSRDVSSLLMQADAYKDYGINKERTRRLVFPQGDNAVDLYLQVLAMEPGNEAAKAGLSEIEAFYLENATKLCDRQVWQPCHDLARDGLKANPESASLIALRDRAAEKSLGN